MSIRWRLTLRFVLILLVILASSDVLFSVLLQRYLYDDIDNNLKVYSARVHGTLNPGSIAGPLDYSVIHDSLPTINEFASPGLYIQIVDADGQLAVKSDNLGNQELPVNPVLLQTAVDGRTGIRTVAAGGSTRVRIMVSPMYLHDQTLVLEVAQSLTTATNTLSQMRIALVIGSLTALLLTALLGTLLVRQTLRPVEAITRTAHAIGQSPDLNRRVGYSGPKDEIGHLATTFDQMIGRLQATFVAQKRFVADASHELRSPLTVIQGNLDLLKRNIDESDRRESLKAIEAESRRLKKITADLLLLAEVEADQKVKSESVSLMRLVDTELKRAQPLAGTRRIVAGEIADLQVRGDPFLLGQVLANLVDNAVKYTPEGGQITLAVCREGSWACLSVSDTGIGISAEHLPYIFDRFYRVDKARSRSGSGTGLGLAIVKGIIEIHGGRVTVVSEPQKGSTFTIWLRL